MSTFLRRARTRKRSIAIDKVHITKKGPRNAEYIPIIETFRFNPIRFDLYWVIRDFGVWDWGVRRSESESESKLRVSWERGAISVFLFEGVKTSRSHELDCLMVGYICKFLGACERARVERRWMDRVAVLLTTSVYLILPILLVRRRARDLFLLRWGRSGKDARGVEA